VKVYSVQEHNDYYTTYEEGKIEECADDFLTEEEVDEIGSNLFLRGSKWQGNFTIFNVATLDRLTNEIVAAYSARPDGQKTAKWRGEKLQDLEYTFRGVLSDRLKKHGIKVVYGRIWPIEEKKEKVQKNTVRSQVVELIQRYCQQVLGLDITFERTSYKNNQWNAVKFARNQLKFTTFDKFFEKAPTEISRTWTAEFTEKEKEYLREWWKQASKGSVLEPGEVPEG